MKKKVLVYTILFAVAATCLPLLPLYPEWSAGSQAVLGTLGSTALAVLIVASTVDGFFKRDIAQDVFHAAMGYVMPESLRPGLQWLYGQTVLCTQHLQTVELTPITLDGQERILMGVRIDRRLENFGHKKSQVSILITINEWFCATTRTAQFLEAGYELDGQSVDLMDLVEPTPNRNFRAPGFVINTKVDLNPESSLTYWWKFEEVKQQKDSAFFRHREPCTYFRLEMLPPPGFTAVRHFPRTGDAPVLRYRGFGVSELGETILPNQVVSFSWWKDEQAEQWRSLQLVGDQAEPKPAAPA